MKYLIEQQDLDNFSLALSSPDSENSAQILRSFIDSYFEDTSTSFFSFSISKSCKFRWNVEAFYKVGEPSVCLTQDQCIKLKAYLTKFGVAVSDIHHEDDLQGGQNYQAQKEDYIVLDCSKTELLQKIKPHNLQPGLSNRKK